jgi:hypothetical protein
MFVRWKKRKVRGNYEGLYSLEAVLMESHREGDEGKQRVIKHLGTIAHIEISFRRRLFYRDVEKNLDSLNLKPAERKEIEGQIRQKVPMPTQDDIDRERLLKGITTKKEITSTKASGPR